MTADDQASWKQPPPPRPRRRNALILRLYDAPIFRDPLAWWTVAVALLSFVAILTPSATPRASNLPPLLDALLAMVVMTGLFALIPTAVRLQVRRAIWRRRERRRYGTATTPGGSPTADTQKLMARPPAQSPQNRPGPPQPPGAVQPTGAPVPGPARSVDPPPTARPRPTPPPGPSATPEPTTQTSTEDLVRSRGFGAARRLQYPLARYIRSIQQTSDAGDRYVVALEAGEVLAMVLGMSAAAWLRHVNALPDRLSALTESYEKGIAFGVWLDIARRTAKVAAQRNDVPPALAAFATPGTKEKLALLDVLVQERNRYAHGYRPRTDVEAERRLAEVLPALETALNGAADLEHMPWVVTDSSSFRVKDRTFDVTGRRIMSDHPAFELERWRVGQPMADHRVYIMAEQTDPIDLTPFVVVRSCDTCLSEELFHSARLPRSGATELKSFTSGHGATDASLDEDIRALVT